MVIAQTRMAIITTTNITMVNYRTVINYSCTVETTCWAICVCTHTGTAKPVTANSCMAKAAMYCWSVKAVGMYRRPVEATA